MKKIGSLIVLSVLCVLLMPGTGNAQAAKTGILTGTVVEEQGQPLPGVEVTISSPSLMTPQLVRLTNDRGAFRFTFLPPGIYTLSATLSGFGTYKTENISVLLNMTTELGITMLPAKLESEVVVVSAAPIIAVENTKLATNIDAKELKDLPVSRSVAAVLNLVPGVVGGSVFNSGTRENSWNIDGVQVTDPGSGSGMSATQSMDAYEEVQIETAGHPAELGNAGGAVVNVITKSGGNTFSGEGSLYFTNSDLQALNIKGTPVKAPTTQTLYSYGINFSFGGPIIKDKLWFFVSSGYSPSKTRLDGFSEDTPYSTINPMGKLSYQPSANHRFSFSFNYNKTRNPYMFAGLYTRPEATFNTTIQAYAYNANWLWTLSPDTILEVRGFHLFRPTNYLSRTQSVIYYDYATGVQSGSANDCLQERLRWQSNATLSQYVDDLAGSHELKVGFEYERGESRNASNYFPDQYGMVMYDTWEGTPLYAYKYVPARVSAQIDPYNQFAGFAQDTWKINKHFVANIGLRYNFVHIYNPPQQEQKVSVPLKDWKNFEPRLSLGIDPFGDGKTGIKVGYARYAHMMWTWFYGLNPNTAKLYMYEVWAPGVFNLVYESSPEMYTLDPDLQRPYVEEFLLSVDRAITKDIGFKASYINRKTNKTVTYSNQNLGPEWYAPITITNPLTGQPMTAYQLKPDAPYEANTLYNNDPRAKNTYQGIIMEVDKKLSHNYSFRFSYTMGLTKANALTTSSMMGVGGFDNPNYSNYDFQMTDDASHVIKFQGIWYAPLGIVLSTNYLGRSGAQYAAYFTYNLGGQQGVQSFLAEKPSSRRMPFLNYFDVRIGKDFRFGDSQLSVFMDLYNALNANTTTSRYTRFGASTPFEKTTGIQSGRLAQFGIRYQF